MSCVEFEIISFHKANNIPQNHLFSPLFFFSILLLNVKNDNKHDGDWLEIFYMIVHLKNSGLRMLITNLELSLLDTRNIRFACRWALLNNFIYRDLSLDEILITQEFNISSWGFLRNVGIGKNAPWNSLISADDADDTKWIWPEELYRKTFRILISILL